MKLNISNIGRIKKKLNLHPFLPGLSLISIVIIALSLYYEYRARQNDYLTLLNNQATIFIKTLSNSAQNEINRMSTIIDHYLRFARPPALMLTEINFAELGEAIIQLYPSH